MSNLHREIVREPEGEKILRALAGTHFVMHETKLDVRGAARWLHQHGYSKGDILAVMMAMSELHMLVVRGDRWCLLSGVFGDGDMNHFILETLETEG